MPIRGPSLPTGRELLPILARLWREQEHVVIQAIHRSGIIGIRLVNLEWWRKPLQDRLQPIYEAWLVQGVDELEVRPTQQKGFLGNVGVWVTSIVDRARELVEDFVSRVLDHAKDALEKIVSVIRPKADDLIHEVQKVFHPQPSVAENVAGDEASRAYHEGQFIAIKEQPEPANLQKRLVTSAGACEVCEELAKTAISIEEPFVPASSKYGAVMTAPIHPNCRCSVIYEEVPRVWPWGGIVTTGQAV